MGLSTTYTKTETEFLIQQLEKKTASGYKGDLRKSDPAPTQIGLYGLIETGIYTNLGGIDAQSGKLNFASFDGTTWSLLEVAFPLPAYSTHFNHTSTDKAETGKSIADFLKKEINYTGIFKSKDMELESGYISQINGNLEPYSSVYATPFIPISILKRRLKLTYTTPYQAYQQFAFYDADKNFIPDGNSAEGNRDFIVPENASFVRFSVENAAKDNYIFEFYNEVDNTQRKRIVTVGASGDFKTITDAVSILNDDFIIHLENGIYDEELKFHNRKITIIGANRNKTIIRGTTSDYYKPAMEVSGDVYFENLTFEETSENISTPAPAMRAYAVHLDYAGAGIMEFNNCIFKGNAHNTLGIGLHNGQKLRFVNCEIHHYNTIGAGCMFAHNNPFPENGVNQAMEVINCNFFLYGGVNILTLNDAAWTWQDGHRVDNGTYFLFINNTFWSDSGTPIVRQDPLPFGVGKIAGNIKLHSASRGNSIAVLNY